MSNFTPGPWTLDKSRMVLGPCFTGELKAICERVRGGNPQEADANARLIAAAPDLYYACNGLLGLLTLISARNDISPQAKKALTQGHRIDAAKAAIAKVEQ